MYDIYIKDDKKKEKKYELLLFVYKNIWWNFIGAFTHANIFFCIFYFFFGHKFDILEVYRLYWCNAL